MPDDVTETNENVNLALKKVAANIFPADAVMNMKQYLNFELKKPNKLMARETMISGSETIFRRMVETGPYVSRRLMRGT